MRAAPRTATQRGSGARTMADYRRREFLVLLLLAHAGARAAVEACANASIVTRLTSVLLAEYEREARPSPAAPTHVALELSVRHARIDETEATAVLVADLYMAWVDIRLKWNASDWGVDAAYVDADELWRPDVTLLNAAQASESDEPARVALSSEGAALWVPRLQVSAPCKLSLDAWPQDEHVCSFDFGSRMHAKDAITYYFHSYEKGEMLDREAGAWATNIVSSKLLDVRRENGLYSTVRWSISVRRRDRARAVVSHVITAAIVTLLASATLVPAESRAPLHATAAMVALVHLSAALARLPPAASAPRVLRLHASLLALATVSAVLTPLVVCVSRLRWRLSPPLLRLLVRASLVSGYREDDKQEGGSAVAAGGEGAGRARAWAAAAQLLDIALFLVSALVIIVLLALYS